MKSPLLQYLVPGLLLGALGGYFFAAVAHKNHTQKRPTAREAFLSDTNEDFDYEKLAQVCLAVSQRSGSTIAGALQMPDLKPADPTKVKKTKEYLDRLMANALERGAWSRMLSFRARQLMDELPANDAAEFSQLFGTAVKQGDLRVAPGAWVPEVVN